MKHVAAAIVVLLALSASSQAADFHDEVNEWVIEPCMEVAAALGVTTVDRDSLEMESSSLT